MLNKSLLKWCATVVVAIATNVTTHAAATPYPDANDASAWPGSGPIRVHAWMTDNRNFFADIADVSQDGIVLIGDSLFGNLKYTKSGNSPYFPGRKIVNRAIGGDVSRGVLWRLQEDALNLNPQALVVLVGTNDLSAHAKVDEVVGNLKAIIAKANEVKPAMPVIICTIPPRESKQAPINNQWLLDTNDGIRGLSGEKNVTIVDLYKETVTADGKPDPQYFNSDLLHFKTPEGYKKIAEVLEPVFEKLNLPKATP